MKQVFKELIDSGINIIYPRRCPICARISKSDEEYICKECHDKITVIEQPRCHKCSKPLITADAEYCFDCTNKNYHYVKGYARWVYDDITKETMIAFKYAGKKEYGAYYARAICEGDISDICENVEAFIPVPIHNKKRIQRGYNQAEILSLELSKLTGIPTISDILIRTIYTAPQKELNDIERRKNLQKAFKAEENNIKTLKKVAIIDDIYTTGSTIDACARCLKKAGIEDVYFICICIGSGNAC